MKHGVLVLMIFMLFALFCAPVFAQPSTKSVETLMLDNFDTEGEQNYQFHGKTYNWTWALRTSRFIADGFPKAGYFNGVPNSLRPLQAEDAEPKVYGVQVAFDRKGDNWFEILPVAEGDDGEQSSFEIPLSGLVKQMDLWVWGANYAYVLEAMIRDSDGRVHVLRATPLNFNGWRNIVINIPSSIRQQSRLRTAPQNLSFVGFRVRTDPNEYVDNFSIFFDQLKFTAHTLNNIFDGYELKAVDFGDSDSGYSSTKEVDAK
ncbi:MAG: flagellar filament protein FlaA [Treponema sp.]|nr:flagellar filament protein FlaA [Treponema sp.]